MALFHGGEVIIVGYPQLGHISAVYEAQYYHTLDMTGYVPVYYARHFCSPYIHTSRLMQS